MTETINRLRFPGLRFPVPLLATLTLLAILGALLLPLTAQAQTATVLVSSVEQPDDDQAGVDQDNSLGQRFSIAAGSGNYTLTSVEFSLSNAIVAADISSLSVGVWSTDSSGLPSASLHTLTNPGSITADTTATFNAQSGATLEAGNTYAVVVSYDKNPTLTPEWSYTESDAFDADPATGWSLSNSTLWKGTGNWFVFPGEIFLIRINGSAVGGGTPSVSTDATLSALSLGTGVTLDPSFDSDTYSYTASVANSVDEVTVTPTTNHGEADVEYLDSSDAALADADTNTAGHQVVLDVGDTVFKVKVTAEDDTTTQDYTVTVTRACALNEGDIWCGVVTVGDITNAQGDTQRHGFQGTTGGLSDKMFSLMFETGTTNNYTITAIVVGATTATSEQLYFVTASGLTDTEEESLALHVDGESDPFVWSDSTEVIAGSYRWPKRTDLDWSSETTVTLRLREFPRPTVTNVEVTSTPALETDTYGAGETIEVSVTFSEAVNATSDTDFVLSVAGAKRAPLLRGSDTATLVFGYTVVSSDDDDNGIWIGNETRTLDGNRGGEAQTGTITSVATGAAANLDHAELGTDSDHKVDGSRTTENVAPSFSSSATISVAENATAVVTVLATDSDTDDNITGYAITGGADQTFFSIGATSGTLTFDAAPNYEDADDSGTNNTYVVDVTATSGAGTRVKTATQTITVTVTNVDEGQSGTVTIDDTAPMVDDELTASTASVADPDGLPDPFAPTWKWYRTPDGGSETEITGETSVTYTVVAADLGATLTAKASWTDNGGFANTLSSAPTGAVAAASALPTLSVGNASATEGADVSFPLTLSAAASEAVTVTCTASFETGDTAVAADLSTTTGTASIGIGATSGPCFIETVQDTIDEDDETFTVTLSGVSSNAQLAADPTAKGTIVDDDDCSADTTTTCAVSVGGSTTGTLETGTEHDWLKVELKADTRYQIDTEGADTGRGTLVDPGAGLHDASGTSLMVNNNDGGVGKNARQIYTPTADAAYYVRVSDPTTSDGGTYTVSVIVLGANGASEADTDFPETTATTGEVDVGGSVTGNIYRLFDQDWFKVDLEAGKTYQIDLKGEGGGGTLDDPRLYNIRDSDGDEIDDTANDDLDFDNDILDSQIIYTPTTTGAYYLVAAHAGQGTGTYTLSVREVTPTLRTDATLIALSLGTGVTLSPTFASDTYAYTASVANSVDEVTVAPTTTDVGATFEYLGSSDAALADADNTGDGHQVALDVGDTVFKVKVTAEDGTTTQTYTVTVTRAACVLETGDIWCGVVTVGPILSGTNTIGHGYTDITGVKGGSFVGDTDITVGSNTYTFEGIFVASIGGNSGALNFKTTAHFTNEDKAALELHIDVDGTSSMWAISDAITSTGEGQILWTTAGLNWSSATTVTARLRPLTQGPTVTRVEITSMPVLETDTYGAGETIEVSVTFSEAVNATSGTDFVLSVAGARRAPLLRGSDTATLVFGYTVVSSDDDDNGIWIGDQDRTLVGNRNGEPQNGTITSVATSAAADLTHDELGTDSDHKVDGSRTTANVAPSFSSSATISVAENQTTVGTVVAADSDADDSVTGYAITGGADQTFFSIEATSGALTFDAPPNYEDADDSGTNNTYVVDVTATSGAGTRVMTATQTITVTVTDVDTEAPGKPGTPTVSAGSATSLRVNWSAPSNAGPAITGYDVRHRTSSPEGSWTEKNVPSIAAVIESLSENTSYDVQVRATNAEGTGAWSDSGNGTTDAAAVLPTLSVGNASATEGADISFPLTLSAAASAAVTVTCTASFETGDTAVAADLLTTTGTASIGIGATSGPCFIETVQDTTDEEDETFTVTLSGVSSNAQLAADPTAKGTIVDDDDCSANNTTACEVDVGGSATGAIDPVNDNDWFRVVLAANTRYQIDVEGADTGGGTLADPNVTLQDAMGSNVTVGTVSVGDNDSGVGKNSRTIYTPTANVTQYVRVYDTSFSGGTYTVSVIVLGANGASEADTDCPSTTATTCRVEVGASATGNIESGTDVDRFKVDLEAGKRYQFKLEGSHNGRGTLPDPYLSLYDGSDNLTTNNDDISPTNPNSEKLHDVTVTGTYYLEAKGARAAATGTYTLSVNDVTPVSDNAPPSFTSSAARNVDENTTAVVTVTATDSDADDNITGYAITGGADQGLFSIGATSGVLTFDAAPNYEDPKDSHNDNDYVVVVQATSGMGTREMTATQTITVTVTNMIGEAPGKPAKPKVSAASATSLRVSWSAPDNEGPPITDYDVQYRAGDSGDWSDANHSGTARATTLTGLTENTSYQVQVRATNAEGTGAWSDSGSGTPAEEDDLPADTSTEGVVEVNGSAVKGDIYKPVYVERTGGDDVDGWDFDTDWFAVELEADRIYRIDMKGQILSSPGLDISGVPVDPDLTLRLPEITAIYDADGNFLVNTFGPDESSAHHLFRVTFHAHDDGTYYIAASGESHEWGGYELTVIDITPDDGNDGNDGDDTNANAGRGLKNLRAVEEEAGVRLTWQSPDGAAVTGYRIERRRADGQDSGPQRSHGQPREHHTLVEDTGNTETSYVDESAEQGVEYEYRVTARNESGPGEESDWVRAGPEEEPVLGDGLPGAPRNLTATPGNKEVTLSWDPPDDNGNPPATRYRIEWRVDGKDYDRNDWGTSQETTYTTNDQANLANGVKYFFRVKAENDDGNSYGPYGPSSGEVSATPTSGSAVDLGTPVLSDTEILHHGMVRLDWQDIEDTGWYVVQYYHLEDEEWLDLPAEGVDIAFHGSSAVVSNLHGLSWLRVGAASCDGASEWSQIEQLYGTNASDWEGVPVPDVEEGDEIEPCPVVLGTPVLSEPEILHHGMVQLDWQDIEDAGWYVVQYYHLEDEEWLDLPAEGVDIAFHGSSAVVSNLHGLSWLRVGAASCDGASEWSQIEESYGTNASDWKGVPVPEVAEGDEIEPCSEDADTPDNSPATGAPTISGTAQVGETLTADTSGIADADGLANATFSYQWLADDSDISGATNATYTLVAADEGKAIKVQVGFTDDAGNEETLTSAATGAVSAAPTPNSPATGAPTISGTAQVGQTLTAATSGIADADGLANATFSYQWLADDTDIAGATGLTYTLTDSEESKAIKVQVSFTDDADNGETLTSAATAAVVAAVAQPTEPPDKPTGLEATESDGQVVLTWDDPGDDSITGYVILRRIPGVDPEGHFDVLVANTGTAATTYTDDTVSAETRYTYRIKAINGAGTSERSRWSHIDTPAAPVPDQPTGLEATESDGQVVLTWDDPGDDSITGYVILRRVRENDTGGDFSVLVADTGTAALTYTDDTVAAGLTYTYRIKAINQHGVSERSRWSHIDTPAAPEAVEGDEQDGEDDRGGAPGKKANVSEPSGGDCPAGTTTTCEVDVGGSVTGNIDPVADVDWFRVVLEAGKFYRIDLEGTETSAGTLPNPYLTLSDSTGQNILSDDDGGDGANSRLEYTATTNGIHYLEAWSSGFTVSDKGTYTLSVREAAPPSTPGFGEGVADLLSNLEQDTSTNVSATVGTFDGAQGFTTGTERNGYFLDSITLDVKTVPNTPDDVSVELWSASSGNPDASIATLTHATGSLATGENTFRAPPGKVLAAETKYFVVVFYSGGRSFLDLQVTETASTDGTTRWAVAGARLHRGSDAKWTKTSGQYLKLSVSASAVPGQVPAEGDTDLPANATTNGVLVADGFAVRGAIDEPVFVERTGDDDVDGYEFDTDWFAVDLKAGRTYRIDMRGAIPTNDLTLRLPEIEAIYDADSNRLANTSSRDATDDANSSHHLARVEFTPHEDGTYYIAATGESFEWGGYELTVIDITRDADKHPADRSTTGFALVDTPVTGKIDFNGDVDWFQLNIRDVDTYQIDLEGQATGRGSLRDPLLRGVYDADGNYISGTGNDDGGEGYNARITRRLEVGIYYIAVGAFGNHEGTYTLSVGY